MGCYVVTLCGTYRLHDIQKPNEQQVIGFNDEENPVILTRFGYEPDSPVSILTIVPDGDGTNFYQGNNLNTIICETAEEAEYYQRDLM